MVQNLADALTEDSPSRGNNERRRLVEHAYPVMPVMWELLKGL